MICIECTESVSSLYTQYSPSNIRLTACPRCNKFADKYIEYDNVLIFVDIILLKPQAYRHLVFNVLTPEEQVWGSPPMPITNSSNKPQNSSTNSNNSDEKLKAGDTITAENQEDSISSALSGTDHRTKSRRRKKHPESHKSSNSTSQLHRISFNHDPKSNSIYQRYFKSIFTSNTKSSTTTSASTKTNSSSLTSRLPVPLRRIFRIPIISDLHLQAQRMWLLITLFDVYLTWARAEQNRHSDLRFSQILEYPILAQYSSFLLLCITESLVTHYVFKFLTKIWINWDDMGTPSALSTTLLIASSSKLFPILMVIWSYDVPFAATVLGWAVLFNTIEAMNIILQCGYWRAGVMTAVAGLFRKIICDHILIYLIQIFWKFVLR